MKRLRLSCLCVCLLVACSNSSTPAAAEAGDPKAGGKKSARKPTAQAAPPPADVESKLPEQRPTPFSVSYQVDTTEVKTTIRVADEGSTFATSYGKQRVSARFVTPPGKLDELYATLRAQKCDQTKTEMERGGEKGGSLLQIQAGDLRKVINDRGNFFPTKAWEGAYEACTNAVKSHVPEPGEGPHAKLEIEFDPSLEGANISVTVDVGADFTGLEWADGQQTATIRVGTIRPTTIAVRGVSQPREVTVDLAKEHGVRVSKRAVPVGDGAEEELVVEALGGAAKTVGEVEAGSNETTEQTKKEAQLRKERDKKAAAKKAASSKAADAKSK